ncbi:carbohydrate-binding module family 12 [Pyrrhoderma noxium]|uniref:Carbohydrate-binding module family 12 n=1 Tax=Pyrrhoderma noxium TaxID=2282107 RepID=A0A286UH12_9AGAM|nr:carbohydrate-binding module family 12 [Pyrrhoderma noxium]
MSIVGRIPGIRKSTAQWQPDFVQYSPGDIVEFEGNRYRNIQGHRSQSDWPPSGTPALWENLGSGGGYQPSYDQPPPQQQQQQQHYEPPKYDNPPQAPPQGYTTDNGVQVEQSEAKKKWYDLDDSKKDTLLAGGLAVGLAALAGGAYYAHEKHKKEGEEEKAQAWEIQNWMIAARQRTEEYLRTGPRAPVTWVYSDYIDQPQIRSSLILGGEEEGDTWFIGRAPHIGGIQPGKCRPNFGCVIGHSHEAIHIKYYEVLIGDSRGVRWVPCSGRFSFESLGARAVDGGHEDDGTPLAIARAHAKERSGLLGIGGGGASGLFPGKASPKLDGAYVTVGDKEVKVEEYEVLVYA